MYIYEVTDHGIDCETIFLYSTSEANLSGRYPQTSKPNIHHKPRDTKSRIDSGKITKKTLDDDTPNNTLGQSPYQTRSR